jgi:hypothetical protein
MISSGTFRNNQDELYIKMSIVVEKLALLLRVWELSDSNRGPDTGYPEVCMVFLYPGNCRGSTLSRSRPFPSVIIH